MSNNPTHLHHLKTLIDKGRVLPIVGAGVSFWSTSGEPTSTWMGLLENGVDYCSKHVPTLPPGWKLEQSNLIRNGETDSFILVAEEISEQLDAPDGSLFSDWVQSTLRKLYVRRPELLKIIGEIGTLILTTNYDNLIERVLGGPAVTWLDYSKVQQIVSGDDYGVIHLHGYWERPDSIVLGAKSYGRVAHDEFTQAIIRSLVVTKSFLFMGYGSGLSDPNFSKLRAWMSTWAQYSPYGHFRLVRESELEAVKALHPETEKIIPIVYGTQFDDLPNFLAQLTRRSGPSIKARRQQIRWRTLEDLTYPLITLDETSVGIFLGDLAFALIQTFGSESQQQFTMLYRLEERVRDGTNFKAFQLYCHKADFLRTLKDYKTELISTSLRMQTEGRTEEEIEAYRKGMILRKISALKGWKIQPDFLIFNSFGALHIMMNHETLTIELTTANMLSLNSDDYSAGVKTTSELLCFLASAFNLEMGTVNFDRLWEHPSLAPLLVDILDKVGIDMNGVRFNADNDEEWSYVNTRFGVEVGDYLGSQEFR